MSSAEPGEYRASLGVCGCPGPTGRVCIICVCFINVSPADGHSTNVWSNALSVCMCADMFVQNACT